MELKVELSKDELQVVLTALSQRPYGEVAAVIHKVTQQIQPQLQRDQETPRPKPHPVPSGG